MFDCTDEAVHVVMLDAIPERQAPESPSNLEVPDVVEPVWAVSMNRNLAKACSVLGLVDLQGALPFLLGKLEYVQLVALPVAASSGVRSCRSLSPGVPALEDLDDVDQVVFDRQNDELAGWTVCKGGMPLRVEADDVEVSALPFVAGRSLKRQGPAELAPQDLYRKGRREQVRDVSAPSFAG